MEIINSKKSSIYDFNREIIEGKITASVRAYALYFLAIFFAIMLAFFPSFANSQTTDENSEIIKLTNIEREKYNLPPLIFNEELHKLAQLRASDMDELNYFEHTNPYGKKFKDFLPNIDYDYIIAGENLALNFYDKEKLLDAWMASASHKKNIINPNFSDIAIYYGEIKIFERTRPIAVMILGREK
jgi:uncharacterized protein YkwD